MSIGLDKQGVPTRHLRLCASVYSCLLHGFAAGVCLVLIGLSASVGAAGLGIDYFTNSPLHSSDLLATAALLFPILELVLARNEWNIAGRPRGLGRLIIFAIAIGSAVTVACLVATRRSPGVWHSLYWPAVTLFAASPHLALLVWTRSALRIHPLTLMYTRERTPRLWRRRALAKIFRKGSKAWFCIFQLVLGAPAVLVCRAVRCRQELKGFVCRQEGCTYRDENPQVIPVRGLPTPLRTWPTLLAPVFKDASDEGPPHPIPTWIGLLELEKRGFRRLSPPGCPGTCGAKGLKQRKILIVASNESAAFRAMTWIAQAFARISKAASETKFVNTVVGAAVRGLPLNFPGQQIISCADSQHDRETLLTIDLVKDLETYVSLQSYDGAIYVPSRSGSDQEFDWLMSRVAALPAALPKAPARHQSKFGTILIRLFGSPRVHEARVRNAPNEMIIVGMSASEEGRTTTRFIKTSEENLVVQKTMEWLS